MGLSLALIPVVLFPVVRRVDEVLAIGYLIVRGAALESVLLVLAVGWLMLRATGRGDVGRTRHGTPAGMRLGNLAIILTPPAPCSRSCSALVPSSSTSCSTRSRIVPHWIALWGLVGIPFYVAADVLAVYGVIAVNSTAQNLLFRPAGHPGDGAGGLDDRTGLPGQRLPRLDENSLAAHAADVVPTRCGTWSAGSTCATGATNRAAAGTALGHRLNLLAGPSRPSVCIAPCTLALLRISRHPVLPAAVGSAWADG